MTDLKKAAQQALEALEDLHRTGDTQVFDLCHRETTEALRAALEQPEQEPVAWLELRILSSGGYASPIKEWHVTQNPSTSNALRKPLFTHPPRREWRSLSEEEFGYIYVRSATHEEFARAVEAALKEKNHE